MFRLRLSHTFLSHEDAKELWSLTLNSGGTTVLHRDEAKMFDKMLAKDKKLANSNLNQLLNPAHTDTMPSEYLSLEAQEKWIGFGLRLSHTFLSHEDAKKLWSLALNSGGTTVLHRDEAKTFDMMPAKDKKLAVSNPSQLLNPAHTESTWPSWPWRSGSCSGLG